MTNDILTQQTEAMRRLYLVPRRPTTIIHCPRTGCAYASAHVDDGKAMRTLAHHLVHDHMHEHSEKEIA